MRVTARRIWYARHPCIIRCRQECPIWDIFSHRDQFPKIFDFAIANRIVSSLLAVLPHKTRCPANRGRSAGDAGWATYPGLAAHRANNKTHGEEMNLRKTLIAASVVAALPMMASHTAQAATQLMAAPVSLASL